ncbi:hypothetical protein BV25DRAFT_1767611, partial [Artomyces pyxidatus]
ATVQGFKDGISLMPHQVIARLWMKRQEESEGKRGGILADEMGLGKTMQALTRIVDDDAGIGPTLIVCPVGLMTQWKAEIQSVTKNIKAFEHHGAKRPTAASVLSSKSIVITSYAIVTSEYSAIQTQEDSAKARSALFNVHWRRIILDEAHIIKDRSTKAAIACSALEGDLRWCLTGTPLQNRIDELFSYLKFLRISPMDDWDVFNTQLLRPFKGEISGTVLKRLHAVLQAVMLRRNKDCVALPVRHVHLERISFTEPERVYYDELEILLREQAYNAYASNQFAAVLRSLLRLRQACCHFSIGLTAVDEDEELTTEHTALPYPIIRSPLTGVNTQSPKMRKLLDLLKAIMARPGDVQKTVIFTQFLPMLDLIGGMLSDEGVGYVRYEGNMNKLQRENSLRRLREDSRIICLLVSLKAGGIGLNMTMCNNVILMDPWWNPALEAQAFDRVHRVGQTRDVHIYKLIIEGTVEERVLRLQKKKQKMADHALAG